MRNGKPKQPIAPFLAYLAGFYATWICVWVYCVYPWAVRRLGDTTLSFALTNIGFRVAIWVLPVFWYLRKMDHANPVEYLLLRSRWKRGLAIGISFSIINLLATAIRIPPSHWRGPYVTWNSILSTSILVGFFEEVPFRGFILQKLQKRLPFWLAAITSSLLFVAIHIPGWILLGALTLSNVALVFIFGMLMALIFRFSRSLWGPIVAHSLNDFFSLVLVHR